MYAFFCGECNFKPSLITGKTTSRYHLIMRYSIFLLLITLLCSANAGLQAQTWAGQVKDASDGQPLAFVAIVIKDTQKGTWSDIDGYFELEIPEGSAEQVVQFRFLGYNTYEIIPGKTLPDVVLLTPIDTGLPEVVVRPGKNPAERIIQAAIDNKKTNDPERSCSFRYDSYNKLVFTARLDSALIYGDSATVPMDSSTMQMVNFFRQQHIMMMESVSQRRYMPPGRSEETIIA
ncbi:MAG: carboxypeptidase-like regulatory domain-containing protein, partial [Flavobacteriales bacterium]|nr:carboxypeptidase-like regulatory domain-containing protein [Flavobacteriales bacterium]